jgi:hypothetical protein
MNSHDLDARMKAVEKLISLFRLERIVRLTVTTISLVMLLISAAFLLYKSQADYAVLTLMFGSSGLITYSANRLLRMWDQALQVLVSTQPKGEA